MISLPEPYAYAIKALYRYHLSVTGREAGMMVISNIIKYDEAITEKERRIVSRLYQRLLKGPAPAKLICGDGCLCRNCRRIMNKCGAM